MNVRPRIVAFGEVLWDVFPDGARLGGAPANFAVHAASLGAEAVLVSRVGKDAEGTEALRGLEARGVNVDFVQEDAARSTGAVRVTLTEGEPAYEIVEGAAWDAVGWEDRMKALAQQADTICFGTLAQRCETSRSALQRFVAEASGECLKVLDLNFRQQYHSQEVVRGSLCTADLLKLSQDEVPILRDYVEGVEDDTVFLLDLLESFRIEWVVLTLGAQGCRVVGPEGDCQVPAEPQEVVNTVGAGDAFTAAFVLNLLAGEDVRTCAERANRAGGYVTTQDSATPDFPEAFRVFSN